MNFPQPEKVVNHAKAIEGTLNRDIFIGAGAIDFFKSEASLSAQGVGRAVSQGVLCFQAGTAVMLTSEVHFPGGDKLGYFMIGGRPPLLMADLRAFRMIAWDELVLEMARDGHVSEAEAQAMVQAMRAK